MKNKKKIRFINISFVKWRDGFHCGLAGFLFSFQTVLHSLSLDVSLVRVPFLLNDDEKTLFIYSKWNHKHSSKNNIRRKVAAHTNTLAHSKETFSRPIEC